MQFWWSLIQNIVLLGNVWSILDCTSLITGTNYVSFWFSWPADESCQDKGGETIATVVKNSICF